ncbi:rhomboid family intramembrane serine protease [Aestuariivirga sp.]|uniref:rhomboid family intramembrane serine protease n=1 Tax=Aestuariivirga sp. TaxID=2650926 RepID=UPI0039E580EC
MFVPLHDSIPLKVIRFQFVTLSIITVNVVIWLSTGAFGSDATMVAVAEAYGLIPAVFNGEAAQAWHGVPEPFTLITYMFLHAGWWHLFTNMLFLWVFADNVEDAFGYAAFLCLYLVSGIAGGLLHVALEPAAQSPLIGASAAVSGVLGAYAVLYPRSRVWVLLFTTIPLKISAMWVLGAWFVFQFLYVFLASARNEPIAWWSHIGGFAVGVVITWALRHQLIRRLAS